ncbi:hypothetical protein JHK85_030148 [Glycine max]|nr:hypothetical protein JHK85_030148 [Glycine max]
MQTSLLRELVVGTPVISATYDRPQKRVAELAGRKLRCECKNSPFGASIVAESKLYVFCGLGWQC